MARADRIAIDEGLAQITSDPHEAEIDLAWWGFDDHLTFSPENLEDDLTRFRSPLFRKEDLP